MSESPPFLATDEPPPFAVVNGGACRPVLLVCDHASRRLPRLVGDLGLDTVARHSHRAVDIGAMALTRKLASVLDTVAVLAGYSRLVVDCNRDLADPQAFVAISDGVAIPGNAGLTAEQRRLRAERLYWPYHQAIAAQLARLMQSGTPPVVLAIHSFTPVFAGVSRPWEVGILWDGDARVAAPFMDGLRGAGFVVGDNQPYSAHSKRLNHTLVMHAATAGLPHACVEVRQDLIEDDSGVDRMAAVLHHLVEALPPSLYSVSSRAVAAAGHMDAPGNGAADRELVARRG